MNVCGDDSMDFEGFFVNATGRVPYPWQMSIAKDGLPALLDVPTGMGKTEGIALAWAWRHLIKRDEPRHLVYCLPMRVLVDQTAKRLRSCFSNLAKAGAIGQELELFVLMGGSIEETWEGCPDKPWILVGTQDQLLSRALNRGYASSRYSWPVDFGLLNNDCRWVVDETQLMGPGLWTSAQLDWMRQSRFKSLLPCPTTWMSATLDTGFLGTFDRKYEGWGALEAFRMDWRLPSNAPEGLRARWARLSSARRVVDVRSGPSRENGPERLKRLAGEIVEQHEPGTLSLVVCNTVRRAQGAFVAVKAAARRTKDKTPPVILLTSRFRSCDRRAIEQKLRDFEERRHASRDGRVPSDPGLYCVSTQVVEAGVDVSARRLWSEIAPWPAVVQRLGRLNRDGREEDAKAIFWPCDPPSKRSQHPGPYAQDDLDRAERLLEELARLSLETSAREALAALAAGDLRDYYKRAVRPVEWSYPRAFDVHGLFATERDVHGGFTDVSQFVRGSDPNGDVTVFWRRWAGQSPSRGGQLEGPPFAPDEGCAVDAWRIREFLRRDKSYSAWLWGEDQGRWERVKADGVRPGMVLMLPQSMGGYDASLGWTGEGKDRLATVPAVGPGRAFKDDPRSEPGYWASLGSHLADARREAASIATAVGLPDDLRRGVVEAAGWHDLGKAHPQWQEALSGRSAGELLAKYPPILGVEATRTHAARIACEVAQRLEDAQRLSDEVNGDEVLRLRWALRARLNREQLDELLSIKGVKRAAHRAFRPGLRHEAASALAMWGRYRAGSSPWPALSVYLAAAHHGKVRTVLRALGEAGADACGVPADSAPLAFDGQSWQLDFTCAADGAGGDWVDAGFRITEPGWTALVTDLLGPWGPDESWDTQTVPAGEPRALGPFALAYLEALVRAADWRASTSPSAATYPCKRQPAGSGHGE